MGIEKLDDFDYKKIRHSKTVLTPRRAEKRRSVGDDAGSETFHCR